MNRYVKAMEIGLDKEKDGISYFDLVKQLEDSLGWNFGTESELTFLVWFADNFSKSNIKLSEEDLSRFRWLQKMEAGENIDITYQQYAQNIKKKLNYKYWLNGNAAKQYLDYQELQESRKAATSARNKANWSILIAIAAILISGGIGVYQIINPPEYPSLPFDVRVIEDMTKTIELENENKKLKEELYKADLLIEMYESEDSDKG